VVRLYSWRFFQRPGKAPFARKEMEPLFNLLDIPVGNVYNRSSAAQGLTQETAGMLDLSGMDLRRADLRDADLRGARMDGMTVKNARVEGVRADDEGLFGQMTAQGGCP
jgi:uncharacterized protein YjbI with pentapeptide repeats